MGSKRQADAQHKVYFAPTTPCDRLLAHDSVEPAIKETLKARFNSLDPVRLLQEMRTAQQILSEFAGHGVRAEAGRHDPFQKRGR